VLDEPVSALDVSIRAQILNLLLDLQRQYGLGYLLIAHDLAVVEYASDTIAAMYLGKIIETCDSEKIFRLALHPYTQTLAAAVPVPDAKVRLRPVDVRGEPPSALNVPGGCRFHPRCPRAEAVCLELEPRLEEVSPDHWVACHLVNKKQAAAL
jgi:oligopeptide/dipeptide ABC transporter ATP-binding protein